VAARGSRRRGYVDFGQRLLGISIGAPRPASNAERMRRRAWSAPPTKGAAAAVRERPRGFAVLLSVIRSSRQKYCAASRGHVEACQCYLR